MAKTMREKKSGRKPVRAAKVVAKAKPAVQEAVVTPVAAAAPKKGFSLPKFNFKGLNNNIFWKVALLVIVFVVTFSLVDLLVQYLNNGYSMAVVNGVRISRREFNERLEKAYGVNASQALIDEELELQEAAKKNIQIKKEDIDARVKEIETQLGGKEALDQALVANNIDMNDLERQIKLQFIQVAVLKPTIKVSDENLKSFFDQYKDVLYEKGAKFEDKKADVTEKYIEKSAQDGASAWLETLRKAAKIQNNVTDKPKYGFMKTTVNVVKNLYNQIKDALKKK